MAETKGKAKAETDQSVPEFEEDLVRDYLKLIKEPDQLIDVVRIEALQEELDAEEDPVERIKIRSRLEEARNIPADAIKRMFIEIASNWMKEQRISAVALLDEGVPPEVLKEAGIELNGHAPESETKPKPKKKAAKKKATAKAAPAEQAKTATAEEVAAYLVKRKSFTIPQAMEKTGASRSTVKKVIDSLIEEGKLVETNDTFSSGRGRAATLYARST